MKIKLLKLIFLNLSLIFTFTNLAFSQDNPDNTVWSWVRVDGVLDEQSKIESNQTKFPYSIEWHYRLKNDAQDFSQFLLRPMLGYNLDENQTLWVGYALITQDRQGEIVNEQRLFQMITIKGKVLNSPVLFLSSTRLEERMLEDYDDLNLRLRQSLRLAIPLIQNKNYKLSLIFQDEVFLRLNQTQWAGQRGYDQNRLYLGVEHQTTIGKTPITFNAGYMNLHTPSRTTHMVNVGVRININNNKKKPRKIN
jgi:hypothetical protein